MQTSQRLTVVTCSILLGLAGFAMAQQQWRADRKVSGSAYRPHTSATYHRGAVEHAGTIRYYAQNHPTVAQETAKLHAAEVRKNLTGAKQEIQKLKDDKTAKFDKETQELIAAIQKLQKEAEGHCDMLDAECAKGDAEGAKLQACCGDLYESLKKADELHDKLMTKLGIKKIDVEKAPEPKK